MTELDVLHGCGYVPLSPAGDVIENGFHAFEKPFHPLTCNALHNLIMAQREFGPGLFLTEAEFDADPQFKGVNPRPGRNMLEKFQFSHSKMMPVSINKALMDLLGPTPNVLDAKLVCGVPEKWVPEWLLARIKGNPVNNLGAYIRPEYRDMTYFMGIDWHQDIIDWPCRVADFVTLYVYLHEVTEADCPLHVMVGSHYNGARIFPHHEAKHADIDNRVRKLTGPIGAAYMWHPFTLHGTQPCASDSPRISLRVLIEGSTGKLNSKVAGPLSLDMTRRDLSANGAAQVKGNVIASA